MTVGVCGLGLIGGSMAKAYREYGHLVYGHDINEASLGYACLAGIIDGRLDDNNISDCDLLFIALYPQAAIKYLEDVAPRLKSDTVVIDLCGTKQNICDCGFALAKKYGK